MGWNFASLDDVRLMRRWMDRRRRTEVGRFISQSIQAVSEKYELHLVNKNNTESAVFSFLCILLSGAFPIVPSRIFDHLPCIGNRNRTGAHHNLTSGSRCRRWLSVEVSSRRPQSLSASLGFIIKGSFAYIATTVKPIRAKCIYQVRCFRSSNRW